jgi:hypothetical protein
MLSSLLRCLAGHRSPFNLLFCFYRQIDPALTAGSVYNPFYSSGVLFGRYVCVPVNKSCMAPTLWQVFALPDLNDLASSTQWR